MVVEAALEEIGRAVQFQEAGSYSLKMPYYVSVEIGKKSMNK